MNPSLILRQSANLSHCLIKHPVKDRKKVHRIQEIQASAVSNTGQFNMLPSAGLILLVENCIQITIAGPDK